jgi:hypothetical protein
VLIASSPTADREYDRIVYLCHELGIECRDASMFLRQQLPEQSAALEVGS